MAYIVRDSNPQYGGQCYFVGTRSIRDPQGRKCEAADFGDREHATKFTRKDDANSLVRNLNKIAGREQFIVEENNIYKQQYGRRRATNGFAGYGTLPNPEMEPAHGGFQWQEEDGGYNGF